MQVERRVNLFTMPRRRRFKPRIDCVAILGKLSSRLVTRAATHIYNPSKPPFDKRGFFLCLHTNAEPRIRLKEPAIAGYVYNPPQTPPLSALRFFSLLRFGKTNTFVLLSP